MQFSKVKCLRGTVAIPGDKSISHRAIMFGSLAQGTTEITNFLQGADCLSTIDCFRRLGVFIENTPDKIIVHGNGLHGLKEPASILDTGNSGTTTRLISGILAGQTFNTTLTGDSSIRKRPMKRIIEPLTMMGANITSVLENDCAPLNINGSRLHGIKYTTQVASAQVKSAILLAGLYADGPTSVTEPYRSRNHSEIMLRSFGINVERDSIRVTINPPASSFEGQKIPVPGDISSAAYFIAAALIIPGSEIMIKNVGINETRDGILRVAAEMGGNITLCNERIVSGEPVADILARSSDLHGITIGGAMIPTLIDEIPIIAVMAAFATGTTLIKDASELKVKESNRIDIMVENLSAMGVTISGTKDGMIIDGSYPLTGAVVDPKLDHRIAMAFTIAGIASDGITKILGEDCVKISYPDFYKDLKRLIIK